MPSLLGRGRRVIATVLGTCAAFAAGHAAPALAAPTRIAVDASDASHLTATVDFGDARLTGLRAGGEAWTRVDVDATDSTVGPENGTPAIPILRRLIAVPAGADVSIRSSATYAPSQSLNLYPFQG